MDEYNCNRMNRRDLLQWGALSSLGMAGLASLAPRTAALAGVAGGAPAGGDLSRLIAAARKEGHLNVIALPRAWANYGALLDTFRARYGLALTEASPNDSSAQEVAALQALKGQSRAPDCVDVSPAWAVKGQEQGLYRPYKVAPWDSVPPAMKDPHGSWVGDYYGVPAFLSVNSVVREAPRDWSDLLSPTLRGLVALGGDPRQAGDAFGAVFAAALANGGSLDNIAPGIDFFARLKRVGNFNPTVAFPANIAKGATPVAIRWDYLLLAARDAFQGNPAVTITIPRHGLYAGYYCQAISASAPHPNAAKLWQEFLFSDVGQVLFLHGYTHPARYADLARRGQIPATLAARLPPPEAYRHVRFATIGQIMAAQQMLLEQWGPKVVGS